ncbi:hypothetical protein GCM10022278_23760 [Allohahella marinimesophila]|uniref:EAL domain-containing protein n=1 Tax=Allohahella marinimesophila TaxID=1054972 RepID=A0ABP7PGA1_9GAMM
MPVEAHFEYLVDPEGTADLEEVLKLPEHQWQLVENGNATFGISDESYWLRFSVRNETDYRRDLIAELAYPLLDDVVFHVFSGEERIDTFATGDTRPFEPRQVDHPNMLLRFVLASHETKTIYVRVRTDGSMILPLKVWRENQFFEAAAKEQKLHFFFFGCLTIIIMINMAIFLKLWERLYLFYALAIAGYLLFFISMRGYGFQHDYPQSPVLHGRALLLSMPFLALFSVLFCREFLKTKTHSPRLDFALKAMICFEVVNLLAAFFMSYNVAVKLSALSSFVFFSLLFVAGPITWAAGLRAGMFFTIAWTPLTVGVLATAGRSMGFFPENFLTQYAMQIGSGLEAFILTLALADRLHREREDKIEAQADRLRMEISRHEAQTKLTDAMMHDPVTRLPNRNRFEWVINQQLRLNPEGHYMVGVARVTRMEEINRTLDLARSERLIQDIALQMKSLAGKLPYVQSVRDDMGRIERVYQISGDTFGLLLDAGKVGDNFEGLELALRQLSEPVLLDNLAIELHPKFGAATYPMHGDHAAMLIRNAHVGMEIAPRDKRAVGFYSRNYDIYSESRLTLMSDLREALHNSTTAIHYQPKLCLINDEIVGLEALIRWHHPERGWVFPVDFIPLAEDTGVITQLTRWVFENSIRELDSILTDYPQLEISINISARDLVSGDLRELIEPMLARIEPGRLTLELTETAAMEDPEKGLIALKALADLGLKVSIDDFGSGYSSLSYLKRLPATEIKLDRSLITDICTSESSRVIVATAINMAHGLGYRLVAEGVENEETGRLLKTMGCDRLQGFWLCHPLPVEKLKLWLAEHRSAF